MFKLPRVMSHMHFFELPHVTYQSIWMSPCRILTLSHGATLNICNLHWVKSHVCDIPTSHVAHTCKQTLQAIVATLFDVQLPNSRQSASKKKKRPGSDHRQTFDFQRPYSQQSASARNPPLSVPVDPKWAAHEPVYVECVFLRVVCVCVCVWGNVTHHIKMTDSDRC